jgi:hypothetical protein
VATSKVWGMESTGKTPKLRTLDQSSTAPFLLLTAELAEHGPLPGARQASHQHAPGPAERPAARVSCVQREPRLSTPDKIGTRLTDPGGAKMASTATPTGNR